MATVYFATNRNPITKGDKIVGFGKHFSPNGLDDLRFGIAKVKSNSITINVLPDNPKKGSKALFKKIKTKMGPEHDTIVFIHGYNVSFDDAMRTGAAMAQKYSFKIDQQTYQPNIFVFSWPSDGQNVPPSVYSNDRRDAKASGLPFARGLMKFSAYVQKIAADDFCDGKIHLLAHSMGVYVLRWALQEMRGLTGGKFRRMFDQVILAAADEDDDTFEFDYKLARLPQICQRNTVYFNNYDAALVISDITKNNPERLGHDGPRHPHQIPGKVVLVDVTDFSLADISGHAYYINNDTVIEDIQAVLLGVSSEEIVGRNYIPHANKFRLPQV